MSYFFCILVKLDCIMALKKQIDKSSENTRSYGKKTSSGKQERTRNKAQSATVKVELKGGVSIIRDDDNPIRAGEVRVFGPRKDKPKPWLKQYFFPKSMGGQKKRITEGETLELVGSASFNWNDDSRGYALVTVIRNGITYNTFKELAKVTPLLDSDWAEVLDTTTRTLDRYKKDNKRFSSKQTETIVEIKQLMQFGEEVFGDLNNFHAWLMTENIALGGIVPKDLLDTSVGLGMVKDSLGRIEHGILA